MGVGQILIAVELIGRNQRALLHFMKYVLYVDEPPPLEVDVDSRAQKLLDEHRHVEAVRVEPAEVAARQELRQRLGHLGEARTILHILVGYAVYGRGCLGNVHFGVQLARLYDPLSVGHDLDHGYLDYAVVCSINARRLQVEEDDRAFEFQLHICSILVSLCVYHHGHKQHQHRCRALVVVYGLEDTGTRRVGQLDRYGRRIDV